MWNKEHILPEKRFQKHPKWKRKMNIQFGSETNLIAHQEPAAMIKSHICDKMV